MIFSKDVQIFDSIYSQFTWSYTEVWRVQTQKSMEEDIKVKRTSWRKVYETKDFLTIRNEFSSCNIRYARFITFSHKDIYMCVMKKLLV